MGTEGKVIRCKAAVAWEPRTALSIEEVEVAPPKAHEVRIKIVATGVCHTDLAVLRETSLPQGGMHSFPVVLGHEGAAVVESVGPGVSKFSKGDTVIPLFAAQCGECEYCQSPKTNMCKTNWDQTVKGVLPDGTSRITCRGKEIHQLFALGTFSEYTVVSDIALAKIRKDAPLEKVCLLGCGISTGYGAAINSAKVEPGSTCAVFGLGAVGLAAVMGCKAAGASRIFAVDLNKDKFPKAQVFGATDFVNPKDHDKPISQVLAEMTDGGVDFALECVGNVDVMRAALDSCRSAWGTCVILGYVQEKDMSVPPMSLLLGRTLKGTFFGGWKSVDSVPKLVDDYMNKKLKVDEFVTHNLSLEKVNEAFDLMTSGKSIRTVLKMA
ncbi:alcohol dehydrogenase class-3-like [Anguilla anguilla]|nr:alcohol dehydrogenase class-3-like [Anguilla anguilla]